MSTDNALIAEAAALPPLEYEQQRENYAKLLGIRVSAFDRLVETERAKLGAECCQLPLIEEPAIDELAEMAQDIIASTNVMHAFAAKWARLLAGGAKHAQPL